MNTRSHWLAWWAAIVMMATLVGCRRAVPETAAPPTATRAPTPAATATATPAPPPPEAVTEAFLRAWPKEDYSAMYAMLTQVSRDALTPDEFAAYLRHVLVETTTQQVDFELLSALVQDAQAQVRYRLTYHTVIFGDLTRETAMSLRLEDGTWRVQWDPAMLLPELTGGRRLRLEVFQPQRGDILDRDGTVLATVTEGYAIGLVPGQIPEDAEDKLLRLLARITERRPEDIARLYAYAQPDWYVAVDEQPAERLQPWYNALLSFSGVIVQSYTGRHYYWDDNTAHTVGYVSPIQPDEVDAYRRRGYSIGARVGRAGLERWGEDILRGHSGGVLQVLDPATQEVVATLGQADPGLPGTIYSTLDLDLQRWTCFAIKDFRAGAAIVLERDTGRVLAMCSRPGFNPNAFEPNNYNSRAELQAIFQDPANPLLNRAAQGQYPPGSVFKLVTMAAALETGVIDLDDIYNCGYEFTELAGVTLTDWTLKYDLPPSGPLDIIGGLRRSCNPFFWHLGLAMYDQGYITAVHDMALAFGLGQPTGIEQIEEESGYIPVPESAFDAVNQAIGQGDVLVTPLQIARLVAAIGNGGHLMRPQLVEQAVDANGRVIEAFQPEEQGTLPVSTETLAALREGMYQVVHHPDGTAHHVFPNWPIPTYGKTGTAETMAGVEPHAWFVAFTDAQDPDRPDIAVVVVLEYGGSGGNFAAPIARRILEAYFYDKPYTLYPWEESFGVKREEEEEAPQDGENAPPEDQGFTPGAPTPPRG
ncbi:MAG: hypothetical protein GXO37_07055 [Chloroflexi bacterium]|nr:hypothetical protein [Chloroflexota bacterium]